MPPCMRACRSWVGRSSFRCPGRRRSSSLKYLLRIASAWARGEWWIVCKTTIVPAGFRPDVWVIVSRKVDMVVVIIVGVVLGFVPVGFYTPRHLRRTLREMFDINETHVFEGLCFVEVLLQDRDKWPTLKLQLGRLCLLTSLVVISAVFVSREGNTWLKHRCRRCLAGFSVWSR